MYHFWAAILTVVAFVICVILKFWKLVLALIRIEDNFLKLFFIYRTPICAQSSLFIRSSTLELYYLVILWHYTMWIYVTVRDQIGEHELHFKHIILSRECVRYCLSCLIIITLVYNVAQNVLLRHWYLDIVFTVPFISFDGFYYY